MEKRSYQRRYNVTFRENEKEIELFDWVGEESQIGGASAFIKLILQQEKERRELEAKK